MSWFCGRLWTCVLFDANLLHIFLKLANWMCTTCKFVLLLTYTWNCNKVYTLSSFFFSLFRLKLHNKRELSKMFILSRVMSIFKCDVIDYLGLCLFQNKSIVRWCISTHIIIEERTLIWKLGKLLINRMYFWTSFSNHMSCVPDNEI